MKTRVVTKSIDENGWSVYRGRVRSCRSRSKVKVKITMSWPWPPWSRGQHIVIRFVSPSLISLFLIHLIYLPYVIIRTARNIHPSLMAYKSFTYLLQEWYNFFMLVGFLFQFFRVDFLFVSVRPTNLLAVSEQSISSHSTYYNSLSALSINGA